MKAKGVRGCEGEGEGERCEGAAAPWRVTVQG